MNSAVNPRASSVQTLDAQPPAVTEAPEASAQAVISLPQPNGPAEEPRLVSSRGPGSAPTSSTLPHDQSPAAAASSAAALNRWRIAGLTGTSLAVGIAGGWLWSSPTPDPAAPVWLAAMGLGILALGVLVGRWMMFARMRHMVVTDSLTHLANRRHFHACLSEAWHRAERYHQPLSLILADLDSFKQINDRYGHPTGDAVLKQVASVLRSNARRTDVVGRLGGEEFGVLMENTPVEGARRIADRIRRALSKKVFSHGDDANKQQRGSQMHSSERIPGDAQFGCTLSLGIATYPQHGASKGALIACADEALYEAKRRGRNLAVVGNPTQTS